MMEVTSLVILEAPIPSPPPLTMTIRSVLASGEATAAAICGRTSTTRSITAAWL